MIKYEIVFWSQHIKVGITSERVGSWDHHIWVNTSFKTLEYSHNTAQKILWNLKHVNYSISAPPPPPHPMYVKKVQLLFE